MIVNLQIEGEHPHCGPNQLEDISGFSYDPYVFISEDINVLTDGWKDMGIPNSINFVLKIVKMMAVEINENKKKVLVHCHAGYGRTGVVVICFLYFNKAGLLDKIVENVRLIRPGTIQSKEQYDFCSRFSKCFHIIRR